MLVIRRHAGESVQIGEEIEVVVIECGSGRVKLGIRAPQHVAVMRSEVRHTREQNLAAASAIRKIDGFKIPESAPISTSESRKREATSSSPSGTGMMPIFNYRT